MCAITRPEKNNIVHVIFLIKNCKKKKPSLPLRFFPPHPEITNRNIFECGPMGSSSSVRVATNGISKDEGSRYGGHYKSEWENSLNDTGDSSMT